MVKKRTKKDLAFENQERIETTRKRHGLDVYKRGGAKGGGKNSPGSFTSESARRAGILSGQARARKQQQALQGGTDGSTSN